MTDNRVFDLAVIGSGAAGQMAMLRGVLNHLKTAVFLGDAKTTRRGRATWVMDVDNIPGMFDRKRPITSTTREVIQFIEKDEKLKSILTTIKTAVTSVKKEGELFIVSDGTNEVQTRFVVLCTGTMDVQPLIKGSIEPIFPFANRGDVLYCIRCDGHRTVGHSCAVIGHKGGAAWIAVMLKERYDLSNLYILTNGKEFEGSDEVRELLEKYNIPIISEEIEEIIGGVKDGLKGFKAGDQTIEVTKAFVSLGAIVYNELAKQVGAEINEREHLLANDSGETSVRGFYAAGDLVQGKKKQVYTAWDMAVDAVDDIDEKIRILKRAGQY